MTGLMPGPADAANGMRGNAAAAVIRAAFCSNARRVRVSGRDSHCWSRYRSVEFTSSTRIRRFYEASATRGLARGGYDELIEAAPTADCGGQAVTTRGF